MEFDFQTLDFANTEALTSHTRRRLDFGLSRHADRITRVVVRLGDENGPRGGLDKFCRLHVSLVDAPPVVIRDCGPELYSVIDRASDRAARAVAKQLDRNRFGRHQRSAHPQLPLPAEGLLTPRTEAAAPGAHA
ncbi:MAG: HPF/RaiA family ribosome-associated protein [Burkholderiaceae bacterium]